jgi:glyoxylase-like metal-dependent hydrolase (beta-lactamase superfamily II)
MPVLWLFTIHRSLLTAAQSMSARDPNNTPEPRIVTIDADYIRPGLAASYLIIENGRAAFVETGTTRSVPRLMEALQRADVAPDAVDYVLLTHVHLDHAGGAGALMQHLPSAKCVVHPRGARHMADPSKLIAGAKEVYGAERFADLYGAIAPIPASRIIEVNDGAHLDLGGRGLEFIHTPGHALHHYCVVDLMARVIFTGDTFGIAYREFDTAQGAFIFVTTTPVQFDPEAAHESIERIMSYAPRAIYPTHFDRLEGLEQLAANLHADLDAATAIARKHVAAEHRTERIRMDLFEHLSARLDDHGDHHDAAFRHAILDFDIELNAQGLDVWLNKANG